MSIADLRQEYAGPALRESDVADDPIAQFHRWFGEAKDAGVLEPNAMTLATCGADGVPAARVLLLKEVDARGFVFYTSYLSDKARQLADNPQASMVFWWEKLQRTVRIVGSVTRVDRAATEAYFATRPRASQIGAWASSQSRVVTSRAVLEQRFAELTKQYEGQTLPAPPFWGGYRLLPRQVELWQGQPSRLHDRLRYTRQADGTWTLERLSP